MKKYEASMAIQMLPEAAGEEMLRIIDKVIEYIAGTGLPYVVGPFETTLEGGLDELFSIARECQLICVREGAPGLACYMKLFYHPGEGVLSIEEKVAKHRQNAK